MKNAGELKEKKVVITEKSSAFFHNNVDYCIGTGRMGLALTQEYQDKIQEQEYNLPVLRSTFEKNVQDATKKPYYMDENGNKVEYDETYYINGEEILLPQLTQEQVDRIVSFVESVNKRGYYNEAISNIISEEAGAYFSGQKSARDVASVIQSRVQVYVNENR